MPRIQLDQNTPYGLQSSFPGHEAKTAYELGRAELANGDLLRAAEAQGFDAMVTCDQNTRYQQNMASGKPGAVHCEQAHQQLKEELGLDHFEGRSWKGLHRHALMTMIAYAFLQSRRLKAARRKKKNRGPATTTEYASYQASHPRPLCTATTNPMPAL